LSDANILDTIGYEAVFHRVTNNTRNSSGRDEIPERDVFTMTSYIYYKCKIQKRENYRYYAVQAHSG